MTEAQFRLYIKRLGLPTLGADYLHEALYGKDGNPAAPARATQSSVGNLLVRYPSLKNRKVLPLESRRVELAIALLLENDDAVLVFLSQPPKVTFHYRSANDRQVTTKSTVDFIVLEQERVLWVEGKPAERMPQIVKEQPGRYQQVDATHWRSAPGEELAALYGFGFRVWTDADFSRERIQNLKHLDPFLKLGHEHFPKDMWKPALDYLAQHPGILLDDLAQASGVKGQALVRWMLAHHMFYCDLDKFLLKDSARVYPSASVAKAMEALRVAEPVWPSVAGAEAGSVPPIVGDLTKVLLTKGTDVIDRMNRKLRIILGQVPKQFWDVTDRTVRYWKAAYKEKGPLGLIDDIEGTQGNDKSTIDPVYKNLAIEIINKHFLTAPRKTVMMAYHMFRGACDQLPDHNPDDTPSHTWFYDLVKLTDKHSLIKAQEGKRAAYPYLFHAACLRGLRDSRGDYPFMDVHCDHTQITMFLRSERTAQVLAKPWWTVLFDATVHAVLAMFLSFDPPSKASIMMVLRDCVLRHKRLPFGMIIDNGPDFRSTYFETLTGANGILSSRRPKGQPRFGNPIENFFGVSEVEFIQTLLGSSLIFKTPRRATKAFDPRDLTRWTMGHLFDVLEFYCFEIFNKRTHPDLGKSPADALTEQLARYGIDQLPPIPFDNDFLINSMPEVDGGTVRVQKPCCVKVRGDLFYNSELAGFISDDLPGRWDPMDLSRTVVQLPTGWVHCESKHTRELQGLSARDVKFFAQEHRARLAATARSRKDFSAEYGKFLLWIKNVKEPALKERLDRAMENRTVDAQLKLHNQETPITTPPPEPVSDAAHPPQSGNGNGKPKLPPVGSIRKKAPIAL